MSSTRSRTRNSVYSQLKGLVAYPSVPSDIGESIQQAILQLKEGYGVQDLHAWEENDVAGRFIVAPVLESITKGNVLIADVSVPNFNVAYEIGFAIGRKKRVLLIRNTAYGVNDPLLLSVGIFDTLGYVPYNSSESLVEKILKVKDLDPLEFDPNQVNRLAPVFVLLPRSRTDAVNRILARIHRARLKYRSFDPEEHGRLAAREAIENVASSHGVILPLLSIKFIEAQTHNLRAAFLAGLAHSMEKELLLLQSGEEPVPLDYRDLVSVYFKNKRIDDHIGRFSSAVTARLQAEVLPLVQETRSFLAQLSLGSSSAENEESELSYYYVETDEYQRALRGEARLVVGRKGTGKTALFVQLAKTLGSNKRNVVLALRPDSSQLISFRREVIELLSEGAREHTLIAFWEYIILLETCSAILEQDFLLHMRDHELYPLYRGVVERYGNDREISEGDFAERLSRLVSRITTRKLDLASDPQKLTEILYKHDIHVLREVVLGYLAKKGSLWVFIDNLDKGWPPRGVQSADVQIIVCLIEALAKLERGLRRSGAQCHSLVFIRNDVFELLVDLTTDRGKSPTIRLDWADPELLRELLRRRLIYSGVEGDPPFEEIWRQICETHIQGEESSLYLIDRCLMRPRALIELVRIAKSHAVNLKHDKVTSDDILAGESEYSYGLIKDIGLEIRDTFSDSPPDLLYAFSEGPRRFTLSYMDERLGSAFPRRDQRLRVIELLLWYGFVGVVRGAEDARYIYQCGYDLGRLLGPWKRALPQNATFEVNPAFWSGLGLRPEA